MSLLQEKLSLCHITKYRPRNEFSGQKQNMRQNIKFLISLINPFFYLSNYRFNDYQTSYMRKLLIH